MSFRNTFYITFLIFSIHLCVRYETFTFRQFTISDLNRYRNKTAEMFQHAYEGYLTYAYPYDELRPLSCEGFDTWGSFSLTLIDALDTLAVMGNNSEFRRVAKLLMATADFNMDVNVSVFETNIRVVGGLLSAHLLSAKAGMQLEEGWPCSGPLLRLAEGMARRLLPAFYTKTGMPYGTVNLRYGVPPGETPITCTAGVGTFIVEFGTLSRLTGDPVFEKVALRALNALWNHRSPLGMVGNHLNVEDGRWTAVDSGIGGSIDSYFEYLVKGSILFQDPKLLEMFNEQKSLISKYMKGDDWYFWVHMGTGWMTMPIFQSLESFWPGLLTLVGDTEQAVKTLYNYHSVWKQYGFLPEVYDVPHKYVKRDGYPLRPELIESVMYLYQATKDPYLLQMGIDIFESIEHSCKTNCGYATVKNVETHKLDDRMESFFLAETTKYLYLLFDPDNFIHKTGACGTILTSTGGDCLLDAGGYVFNTEAHPIDISAVYCCSVEQKNQMASLENFKNTMDLHTILEINGKKSFIPLTKQSIKTNEDCDDVFSVYERIPAENIEDVVAELSSEQEKHVRHMEDNKTNVNSETIINDDNEVVKVEVEEKTLANVNENREVKQKMEMFIDIHVDTMDENILDKLKNGTNNLELLFNMLKLNSSDIKLVKLESNIEGLVKDFKDETDENNFDDFTDNLPQYKKSRTLKSLEESNSNKKSGKDDVGAFSPDSKPSDRPKNQKHDTEYFSYQFPSVAADGDLRVTENEAFPIPSSKSPTITTKFPFKDKKLLEIFLLKRKEFLQGAIDDSISKEQHPKIILDEKMRKAMEVDLDRNRFPETEKAKTFHNSDTSKHKNAEKIVSKKTEVRFSGGHELKSNDEHRYFSSPKHSQIRAESMPIVQTIPLRSCTSTESTDYPSTTREGNKSYAILHCPAQPFTARLSLMGEVFDTVS